MQQPITLSGSTTKMNTQTRWIIGTIILITITLTGFVFSYTLTQEHRMSKTETRLEAIKHRLMSIESKIDQIETKIDNLRPALTENNKTDHRS